MCVHVILKIFSKSYRQKLLNKYKNIKQEKIIEIKKEINRIIVEDEKYERMYCYAEKYCYDYLVTKIKKPRIYETGYGNYEAITHVLTTDECALNLAAFMYTDILEKKIHYCPNSFYLYARTDSNEYPRDIAKRFLDAKIKELKEKIVNLEKE